MPRCALCETDQPKLIKLAGHEVCPECLERVSYDLDSRSRGQRKVRKVVDDKEIAGVCGGLADSMNMDRDTFRLLTALVAIFTGFVPVLVAYLVLAWYLPSETEAV